ncbi:winged helix-turn-helix domain-containing protein [candidate division KSB1 bacterium]|nr:winged helix-turn-helix domain-containing protein [candidate division KSB1 bacterium]
MLSSTGKIFRFDRFTLDVKDHRLLAGDREIFLRPKAFETLLYLIQQHGHLVTKDDLLDHIWSGIIVSETTLTHCIEEVRKALGDNARHPQYLKTIPRVGYKFIALVEEIDFPMTENELSSAADNTNIAPPDEKAGMMAGSSPCFRKSPFHPLNFLSKHLTFNFGGIISLKILAIILVISGLIISTFYIFKSRADQMVSIAVMPFLNLNANSEQDYFVDGLTESLITDLARIGSLKVISRTSIMRFKDTKKSIPDIGRELNVDIIVEGSVFCSAEKVRINAQLIDVKTDQHLWAESYEHDFANIITLQGEIARAITSAIKIKLTPTDQYRLTNQHPVKTEAYHAYLKGRYFWNKRTMEGFQKGIEYFEQAIQIDPDYAQAYVGLADCYNLLYDYDLLAPGKSAPSARTAARTALSLDNTLSEAHASLGFVQARYDWDWPGAEREFKHAIELNHNNAIAHHWYALHLAMTGRFAEAITEISKALELDPLSLIINSNKGWILYFARKYDEAERQLIRTLELDSNFMSAQVKLGWVYEQKGLYLPAIEMFHRALSLTQDDANVMGLIGNAHALAGNKAAALKIINELTISSSPKYLSSYWLALIYVSLDENDQAFYWLDKAIEERSSGLVWLKVDPQLDRLRTDPRFAERLRRVRFF